MFQFRSVQSLSRVRLFSTPWIAARQASLSITSSQIDLLKSYMRLLNITIVQILLWADLFSSRVKTFSTKTENCQIVKTAEGFPGGASGKEVVSCLPVQETWVQSLGREDPLEEGMATHSSILAWRIPWTEEPGGLQSPGSQRVGHDWSDLAHTQGS